MIEQLMVDHDVAMAAIAESLQSNKGMVMEHTDRQHNRVCSLKNEVQKSYKPSPNPLFKINAVAFKPRSINYPANMW
jgi:hypothetical protein